MATLSCAFNPALHRCSSKARAWLQASVFDLYDMLSLAADEEPPSPSPASSSWRGGDRGGRGSARGSGGGGRGRGGQSQQGAVLDTERLAWCVRILGQTAKGGDAHVDLAAELMGRTASRCGTTGESGGGVGSPRVGYGAGGRGQRRGCGRATGT